LWHHLPEYTKCGVTANGYILNGELGLQHKATLTLMQSYDNTRQGVNKLKKNHKLI
jgi:hypothetical protein